MISALEIGLLIVSAIVGYFASGYIIFMLMEVFGYDLSLLPMIKFVQKLNVGRGRLDERIGRQAILVNIQTRIVITLFLYVILALIMLLASIKIGGTTVATIFFTATIGLLVRCLVSVIGEYHLRPMIYRYEGIGNDREVHLRKIVLDGDDETDAEMTFGLEDASGICDLATLGDVVVLLVPPAGGIIYDKML